jgi:hypothetical protein
MLWKEYFDGLAIQDQVAIQIDPWLSWIKQIRPYG